MKQNKLARRMMNSGKKMASGNDDERIFRNKVTDLFSRGYAIMEYPIDAPEDAASFGDFGSPTGISATFNSFDSSSKPIVPPIKEKKSIGTPKLGYIPWGQNNCLPNEIYSYASALPFTATGLGYKSDLLHGYGPKLMYHFIPMDGSKVEDIPYEDADKRILSEIFKIREMISARDKDNQQSSPNIAMVVSPGGSSTNAKAEVGSLEFFLKEFLNDYEEWKKTNEEYERFTSINDVNYHFLQCAVDEMHLDIYFPTIGLSIGRVDSWDPKIEKIGFLPSACCRLEQKDAHQRINYVYYSEQWRSHDGSNFANTEEDLVAYPALSQNRFLQQLEEKIAENKEQPLEKRPTWMCCPCIYPSIKPYYPQPVWWSIFPTRTYDYASTLITDRAIARKNSTMWGKIIFINLEYLNQLYTDYDADTEEKKQVIRSQILKRVESFLKNRENNGKSMSADMYPSADGKTLLKSIEIVDVPPSSQGKDIKDEIEEITSVVYSALGVHPALIGAVPGAKSSSGGTFQRELHLLQQTQMSARQGIYLNFLQNIARFNKWDKKAKWKIAMPVLTTLDRNKTGIEEH